MLGQQGADPLAQQWLIRVFLALLTWPMKDSDAEYQMLQRFLGQLRRCEEGFPIPVRDDRNVQIVVAVNGCSQYFFPCVTSERIP